MVSFGLELASRGSVVILFEGLILVTIYLVYLSKSFALASESITEIQRLIVFLFLQGRFSPAWYPASDFEIQDGGHRAICTRSDYRAQTNLNQGASHVLQR